MTIILGSEYVSIEPVGLGHSSDIMSTLSKGIRMVVSANPNAIIRGAVYGIMLREQTKNRHHPPIISENLQKHTSKTHFRSETSMV